MSVNRYGIYPLSVTYTGPNTMNLTQVMDLSISPGVNSDIIIPAGSVDADAIVTVSADPIVNFGTRDFVTFFTAVSATIGLAGISSAIFRYQKRLDGGVFTGGATNKTISATKGHLIPISITGQQDAQEGSVLRARFIPTFDGTNLPLVVNNNVDFDGGPAPAFNNRFDMGPVYLGAGQLAGCTGHTVNFGYEVRTDRTDGNVFPDCSFIHRRLPTVELNYLNLDVLQNDVATLFGSDPGSAVHVFHKKAVPESSAARVSVGVGSHCKISAASDGAWTPQEISVSKEENATFTLSLQVKGTLALVTNSTIP